MAVPVIPTQQHWEGRAVLGCGILRSACVCSLGGLFPLHSLRQDQGNQASLMSLLLLLSFSPPSQALCMCMKIAETYAFLPREAVTRFLMSCGECQKRMHINPSTAEFKENDRPTSLVPDLIDYNMPLTATYLKQMKLQCMNTNEQDESSVSSEDLDMTEPAWGSTERAPAAAPSSTPEPRPERKATPPQPSIKEEEG
ncbi:nucleolar protein 4-like [Tachysurus ichikawai]